MSKTAFIFPGQGAQYVGMGAGFYEHEAVSRQVFDLASKETGLDIPALCFEENDRLNITEYTQIAMLAAEAAAFKALEQRGVRPDVCAGLSLGEYGALIASGVMDMEDAFRVIRQRGIFMQEAVPTGGAMAAVLGLAAEPVEEICAGTAKETGEVVSIANYNCPGQIVITGQENAVNQACEALKGAGAKRCVLLNVSGPFHSSMLAEAGEKLGKVLQDVQVQEFTIPYVANVTADYVTDKAQVKDLLTRQVSASVRWQQSVERMIKDGVDTFIEIGPGRTLAGFLRKISRDVTVYNVDKYEDLDKTVSAYKGE